MKAYLSQRTLDELAAVVAESGAWARSMQSSVHRSYKSDGTPVTEVDLEISRRIIAHIEEHIPGANIVSEENLTPFDPTAEWTFVLDPIDGTDVYSQGMPCWAVALGILDRNREPVGAMISAPRWGIGEEELFIRLDPGAPLLINGRTFTPYPDKDVPHQITMGSSGQRYFDFSSYDGKIRIFGSAILHLLALVIYPHMQGTIVQTCYAWDVAAAHSVMRSVSMDLEYIDGSPFVYDERLLKERKSFKMSLYGGSTACISALRRLIPPRP